MNYKTIMICAVIGVTMQNAWGMFLEREKWQAQQTLKQYEDDEALFNAADKDELARLGSLAQSFFILEKMGEGIDAYAKLDEQLDVDRKIKETPPGELKNALLKMQAFKRTPYERNNKLKTMTLGLKAGDIAREVKAALEKQATMPATLTTDLEKSAIPHQPIATPAAAVCAIPEASSVQPMPKQKQVIPLGFQQQAKSKDSKLKQCLKSIMLCECLGLQKKADKSKAESPEIIFEGGSMGNEMQNPPIIFEGGSIDV